MKHLWNSHIRRIYIGFGFGMGIAGSFTGAVLASDWLLLFNVFFVALGTIAWIFGGFMDPEEVEEIIRDAAREAVQRGLVNPVNPPNSVREWRDPDIWHG